MHSDWNGSVTYRMSWNVYFLECIPITIKTMYKHLNFLNCLLFLKADCIVYRIMWKVDATSNTIC